MEHTIKVTNDTPFKEWFRQIPLLWLRRLEATCRKCWNPGAIRPSQSAWCNAVVLVQKKDGSLWFCINFCHLNDHMKKASYPLPRIQEALESLVGAGHFSCLDLKSGFWQIKMDKALKQYTTFTVGNLGFFQMWLHAHWALQCIGDLSMAYAELLGQVKPHLLLDLSRWLDCVLVDH